MKHSSTSLFSFFLAASMTAASAEYDCSKGCSTDPSVAGPRVCGVDGTTYMNECLAVCQNVAVASTGSCGSSSGRETDSSSDASLDTSAVIPLEAMNRFEDLKLIGKRDPSKFTESPRSQEHRLSSNILAGRRRNPSQRTTTVHRLTHEGFEYRGTLSTSTEVESALASLRELTSDDHKQLRRRMGVIGNTDDRIKIQDTSIPPYTAIGEIDYTTSSEGGCTAAMISRNVALTSGDCVHSGAGGDYYPLSQLALGRFRFGGNTFAAYGEWVINHVTVFEDWKESSDRTRDYAVFNLFPKTDGSNCPHNYPGDNNYMGFTQTSPTDTLLQTSTIIGYAFDKDDGEMWQSGTPEGDWVGQETGFAHHYLDVVDTGAPVITTDGKFQIKGLHGYGNNPNHNGAPIIEETQLFQAIYAMSERDTPPPECIDTPTTSPTAAPTTLAPTTSPVVGPTTDVPTSSPVVTPTAPPTPDPQLTDGEDDECTCGDKGFLLRIVCYLFNLSTCVF